jgi:hypothetical protein
MARELSADLETDDKPSLLLMSVDALVFWMRNPLSFWIVTLPIASLAGIATWALDRDHNLDAWRGHWGWSFLFALIYAMFLDRWIKASLLDDATPCDEVDNLRRSIVSPRFLAYATALFGLAALLAPSRYGEVSIVLWSASACLFALLLPSLSAAEPLSLSRAFALGRKLQIHLFLLIGMAVAISVLSSIGLERFVGWLPPKPWHGAALSAAGRIVDCLMLAWVGHVLAMLFREVTGWRQPEPDDHPFRDMKHAVRPPRR